MAFKIVPVISAVVWVVWVTVCLIQLKRHAPGAREFSHMVPQLEDRHAGWTGLRNHNNSYRFRTGNVGGHVYLECSMWTPEDSHGRIWLDDEAGRRVQIFDWNQDSSPNRAFPEGITGGNNGIDRATEARILAAPLTPIRIDVSPHVRADTSYKVDFEYRAGNNGTWIQDVRVAAV